MGVVIKEVTSKKELKKFYFDYTGYICVVRYL